MPTFNRLKILASFIRGFAVGLGVHCRDLYGVGGGGGQKNTGGYNKRGGGGGGMSEGRRAGRWGRGVSGQ